MKQYSRRTAFTATFALTMTGAGVAHAVCDTTGRASANGGAQVPVRIVSAAPMSALGVTWLDVNGSRTPMGVAMDGRDFVASSYVGHVFVVEDGQDNCRGIYVVPPGGLTISLGDAAGALQAPVASVPTTGSGRQVAAPAPADPLALGLNALAQGLFGALAGGQPPAPQPPAFPAPSQSAQVPASPPVQMTSPALPAPSPSLPKASPALQPTSPPVQMPAPTLQAALPAPSPTVSPSISPPTSSPTVSPSIPAPSPSALLFLLRRHRPLVGWPMRSSRRIMPCVPIMVQHR